MPDILEIFDKMPSYIGDMTVSYNVTERIFGGPELGPGLAQRQFWWS